MSKIRFSLLFAAAILIASCGTTNSGTMYDPNAPVPAITITTSGSVDPASRSIALPPGNDNLVLAFQTAFTNDGWTISTSTTSTRYLMQLETKTWTSNQALSAIDLSIIDEHTGAKILTGVRKTYSPSDPPIDVTAVADMVVSALKGITAPPPQ
jgi:hypothetical protein